MIFASLYPLNEEKLRRCFLHVSTYLTSTESTYSQNEFPVGNRYHLETTRKDSALRLGLSTSNPKPRILTHPLVSIQLEAVTYIFFKCTSLITFRKMLAPE